MSIDRKLIQLIMELEKINIKLFLIYISSRVFEDDVKMW